MQTALAFAETPQDRPDVLGSTVEPPESPTPATDPPDADNEPVHRQAPTTLAEINALPRPSVGDLVWFWPSGAVEKGTLKGLSIDRQDTQIATVENAGAWYSFPLLREGLRTVGRANAKEAS